MSEERTVHTRTRWLDRFLPAAAIVGPLIGVIVGFFFHAGGAYQIFQIDHERINTLMSWQEKQDEFNKNVIESIARLQEITKRIGRR